MPLSEHLKKRIYTFAVSLDKTSDVPVQGNCLCLYGEETVAPKTSSTDKSDYTVVNFGIAREEEDARLLAERASASKKSGLVIMVGEKPTGGIGNVELTVIRTAEIMGELDRKTALSWLSLVAKKLRAEISSAALERVMG